MTIVEPAVGRHTIDEAVRAARHPGHDPARWALPLIADADRRANGCWSLVAFDAGAEAGALWLPPHAGEPCHGDTMTLGGESTHGHPLAEALRWLRAAQAAYAAANPSCWARIEAARDSTWSPIVIAPFAVGDRTAPPGRHLIVIDGLHRALGWALRSTSEPLHAYLAGNTPGAEESAGVHGLDGR